jgi:UDP-N-acetylglucosamine--N-acetylmuramyl-(pentapeptide) pyrophosphoryl-undecaprenol N-acetylglucosamine transferase
MAKKRVIISGGGTGGHIYPAIAIAQGLQQLDPEVEVLFVGAKGKMEMEKVPQAGYKIVGLWISGFQRKRLLSNLLLPLKMLKSLWDAYWLIRKFKPQAAVGVGGYASWAILKVATWVKLPFVIQEQNSHAGMSNRKLAQAASAICVAYDGMDKYFPANKVVKTGNPLRSNLFPMPKADGSAKMKLGFQAEVPLIVVLGGSLGARTINHAVAAALDNWTREGINVLWQCGKYYISKYSTYGASNIQVVDFVKDMATVYAAADIVVSRSGALTISELCLVQKPTILIPSPNVTEDHQNKNAQALVQKGAAWLLKDGEAELNLSAKAVELIRDKSAQESLSTAIAQEGKPRAALEVAQIVLNQMKIR